MPHLSIAVCDDEAFCIEELATCCSSILTHHAIGYKLESFSSAEALLQSPAAYDLVFMDITMPGMDGFAAAALLAEKHPATKVVFLTGHEEYVREAFRYNAFRYLPKPCARQEVEEAIMSTLTALATSKIEVQATGGAIHYITLESILYLESLGDTTAIHLQAGAIIQAQRLKHWLESYGGQLLRTHKSYLVNLAHVASLTGGHVLLTGGHKVPVSVRNRAAVRRSLQAYIRSHATYTGGQVRL